MIKEIEIKNTKKEKITIILQTEEKEISRYTKDLKITFIKGTKSKTYKVKYNKDYYIKIQKTQLQFNDILDFLKDLQENENVAKIFLNKFI